MNEIKEEVLWSVIALLFVGCLGGGAWLIYSLLLS